MRSTTHLKRKSALATRRQSGPDCSPEKVGVCGEGARPSSTGVRWSRIAGRGFGFISGSRSKTYTALVFIASRARRRGARPTSAVRTPHRIETSPYKWHTPCDSRGHDASSAASVLLDRQLRTAELRRGSAHSQRREDRK